MKKSFPVLLSAVLFSLFAFSVLAQTTTTSPPPPLPATKLLGCWNNDLLNVSIVDSETGAMGGFARIALTFCVNSGSVNPDGTHSYRGSVSWFVDNAQVNIWYVPSTLSARRPYMEVSLYLPLTRFGRTDPEYFSFSYKMNLSSTEDYAWGTMSGFRVEPEARMNQSTYIIPTETYVGTVRAWNQNSDGRG